MLIFISLRIIKHIMTKIRCSWCEGNELYTQYHDQEWGVPLYNDQKLFEFLTLETFQAGLSWITVLKKRENFRAAFDDFNYHKVAKYNDNKFNELIENAGIIRNKLKIKAAINNAQRFMEVQQEFKSFSNYIWGFTNGKPITNSAKTLQDIPAITPLAEAISKDLKKRGFKFVGPTVIYAHMQATGMVNDHITTCFRYHEVSTT